MSVDIDKKFICRSAKVSLCLATGMKARRLDWLIHAFRSLTNQYIRLMWFERQNGTGKELLAKFPSILPANLRYAAIDLARRTVIATKKSAKELSAHATLPRLGPDNAINLQRGKVVRIERGRGSFDFVMKIQSMQPGNPIVIPFKSNRRINHWLQYDGAEIADSAIIGDKWAVISINIPVASIPQNGQRILAVDTNKKTNLFTDSDGKRYGTEIDAKIAKVKRRLAGSMGKQRAIRERDNYINQTVNTLPMRDIAVLGTEDLTGIKRGKKKNRSKNFRKAMAPWVVRKAHDRLEAVAQENRVLLVKNKPANTSRTCPRCGLVSIDNRTGESFECVACHHSGDSGHIAALNVLEKTIRKLSGRISSARVACDSAPILRKPELNPSNQEVCVKLQSNSVATLSAGPF